MQTYNNTQLDDIASIKYDNRWNHCEGRQIAMHSIHAYPAKFPPFIASEAFSYAAEEGVAVNCVADVFCGCGTVALESKIRNIPFWGCDINPVAVMITKAKVSEYSANKLEGYYQKSIVCFNLFRNEIKCEELYFGANERLKYWFDMATYCDLFALKKAIYCCVTEENYLNCFLCIFSSILKTASRWLQKSIKPQVDPNKRISSVIDLYKRQYKKVLSASNEVSSIAETCDAEIRIEQRNILKGSINKTFDLIVTSPPYVTSYEYADLHQLSSLWLDYSKDYRSLRKGSIGSAYNTVDVDENSLALNSTGRNIVSELQEKKAPKSKIKSIARYYSNMESVIYKCYRMINPGGMALFVIGDSESGGVRLENSKHLIESMTNSGFHDIKIGKRTIQKSMCVPFRDNKGKFTKTDNSHNEIYHEEYIISGRRI